jgi:S-adenosylmethionine-dependent methyltransferase
LSFDDIGTFFEDEIYGSSKGYIRLEVLREDLLANIPPLADGGLRILDAGGGAGRVAVWLASMGNEVVLCDASREMLDRAANAARQANVLDAIRIVHATIEELPNVLDGPFDVISCHAVLEWVADGKGVLRELVALLAPAGHLSLMFFNLNASLLKHVLSGRFADALDEYERGPRPRGWGDGATPLAEETVREWLADLGLAVRSKSGIRIFHDHVPAGALTPEGLRGLLAIELALRAREPFASLGQHLHLVCVRR